MAGPKIVDELSNIRLKRDRETPVAVLIPKSARLPIETTLREL
jgi:hypothetical protein